MSEQHEKKTEFMRGGTRYMLTIRLESAELPYSLAAKIYVTSSAGEAEFADILAKKFAEKLADVRKTSYAAGPKEEPEVIPPELAGPEFLAAWAEWQKAPRRKKLTPYARKKQLKFLAGLGVSDAIASIEQSLMQQWIGLFPPRCGLGVPFGKRATEKMRQAWARDNANGEVF